MEVPEGPTGDVLNDIFHCEVEKGSWTLMHRYQKLSEIMKAGHMDIQNRDNMVYLYIW